MAGLDPQHRKNISDSVRAAWARKKTNKDEWDQFRQKVSDATKAAKAQKSHCRDEWLYVVNLMAGKEPP